MLSHYGIYVLCAKEDTYFRTFHYYHKHFKRIMLQHEIEHNSFIELQKTKGLRKKQNVLNWYKPQVSQFSL